jgi:hypothetical protein
MKTLSEKVDKQIENLLVATAMMYDIGPKKLVADLGAFSNGNMKTYGPNHCRSAACFGGWVAICPYFKAQGVTRERYSDGSPTMRSRKGGKSHNLSAYDVPVRLFGAPPHDDDDGEKSMFCEMNDGRWPWTNKPATSDREFNEVMRRIDKQLTHMLEKHT